MSTMLGPSNIPIWTPKKLRFLRADYVILQGLPGLSSGTQSR